DRDRPLFRGRALDSAKRVVEIRGDLVEVLRLETALDAMGIDLDAQESGPVHRRRERLRPAHPAEPGGEDEPAREVICTKMRTTGGRKRLVSALQDALRTDVDPRAGGHLPVHDEAFSFELAEVVPRRPAADEVRVRDEDAGRVG